MRVHLTKYLALIISVLGSALPLADADQLGAQGKAKATAKKELEPSAFQALVQGATKASGAVTVYEKEGTFHLEFPAAVLEKELFWYVEVARTPPVKGPLGPLQLSPGTKVRGSVLHLERRHKALLVRDLTPTLETRTANADGSIEHRHCGHPSRAELALADVTVAPIIYVFPVAATSPEGNLVVDASPLFAADLPGDPIKDMIPGAVALDPSRSFVDTIRPTNTGLEASAKLTFALIPAADNPLAALGSIEGSAATLLIRHSLVALPATPMRPRYFDPRVGFFKTSYSETSGEAPQGLVSRDLICRFRLEKKDPGAATSEPVKPIVFYISRRTPERWRPYLKQAVEDWNTAFESAGFRNALICRMAPDDPDWDPSELRHNVIRWIPSTFANAMGPMVVDPRSGEILCAHIMVWESVFKAFADTYYLLASPNDPAARTLPLSEEVQGRVLRYVISHEVGHSLGLRHNHRASQAYASAQLRDPNFANATGPVASIMSYGRINYAAQPGDGIKRMLPLISAYDRYAIKWGYAPIPSAKTPAAESTTLRKWIEEGAGRDPSLQWGAEDAAARIDPMVLTENTGRDRLEMNRLGFANIKRSLAALPKAVPQNVEGVETIKRVWRQALALRSGWLNAAGKDLYGAVETRSLKPGERQFELVSAARRRETGAYLIAQLETPHDWITPAVRDAFAPGELAEAVASSQMQLLGSMMNKKVLSAAWEAEVLQEETYPLSRYLSNLRTGLFSELQEDPVVIDPVRRKLQAHYVDILVRSLESSGQPALEASDLRPAARISLSQLRAALAPASLKARHPETSSHILDLSATIKGALGE